MPINLVTSVARRDVGGAGQMGVTQMFPRLDNRDARVFGLKDWRPNEVPDVLVSKQMKVATPQVVMQYHIPRFTLAQRVWV